MAEDLITLVPFQQPTFLWRIADAKGEVKVFEKTNAKSKGDGGT